MLAACRSKSLGASANGTLPAKTVCVPIGAPNTAVTVDDFEAWQECDALLESLRPVSCAEIEDSFQRATGCGPACYQDLQARCACIYALLSCSCRSAMQLRAERSAQLLAAASS